MSLAYYQQDFRDCIIVLRGVTVNQWDTKENNDTICMMTSSNGNNVRVTGPLGYFLWSGSEQTVEWTVETLVIWDAIVLILTSVYPRVRIVWITLEKHSLHYNDVMISTIASQITSLTIFHSTFYSGSDERKHQSSESFAFVRIIHRWPVNSPHKGPEKAENVSIWWSHRVSYKLK